MSEAQLVLLLFSILLWCRLAGTDHNYAISQPWHLSYCVRNVLQGEQQETGELRRLHLRLERANEHVNQLQSRLAIQASSAGASCSDQLAEAQHAQQAQLLEIESLQQQLAASQAITSTDSSRQDEELVTQRAKQLAEIESLQQQPQEHRKSCGLDRDQQLEHLRAETAQLQGALAEATAKKAGPSIQPGAEASKLATTSEGTAIAAGDRKQDGRKQEGAKQDVQLEVLSISEWSLDSEPAQWCQLALQDRPAFCSLLGRLQQELQQQRADLAEQKAAAAQHKATISQQADRLAQAASDLTDKASALQRCSEEVAALQSKLTDCKSVTGLQSDQLAVLQSEVDQLRASLAAAEKQASGGAAAEQEVEELRIRLHVSLLVSVAYEHNSEGIDWSYKPVEPCTWMHCLCTCCLHQCRSQRCKIDSLASRPASEHQLLEAERKG